MKSVEDRDRPHSVCPRAKRAGPCRRSTTRRYMGSEAIGIESETLRALRERSTQGGEPIVRLAQRYIGEGMRLDRHPGIVFRDGPAGRRDVVVAGPDVWEVMTAMRTAPERGEDLVRALASGSAYRSRRSGSRFATTRSTRRKSTDSSRRTRRKPRSLSGRWSVSGVCSDEPAARRDVSGPDRRATERTRP